MNGKLYLGIAICATFLMNAGIAEGQTSGMSLNSTGAAANSSAMLDVASTTSPFKGMLIPRVSTTDMNSITVNSSTVGLLVFNTSLAAFYFYNGSAWVPIGDGAGAGTAGGNLSGNYPNPTIANTAAAGNNIVTALGSATTGTIPAARLGTGPGSATTYLDGTGAFSAPAGGWGLTGNAGTTPGTNFVGTTDANALTFKVNGTWAGQIGTGTNVSFGINAGGSISSGLSNTAMGSSALTANTSGGSNTGVGASALLSNIIGSNNVAVGSGALQLNTVDNNTAVGTQAMQSNSTGTNNTATGYHSLTANTTGNANTATGGQSLAANTTGLNNTAMGFNSLAANVGGSNNTAVGHNCLLVSTGSNLTAIGRLALAHNTTAGDNTAVGFQSLTNNTTGVDNTAVGSGALLANNGGGDNTAVGYQALKAVVSGYDNTAVGSLTQTVNTGHDNTSLGYLTLWANTSASTGTAVGAFSLANNTSGSRNTGLGYGSLYTNATGTDNVAIGYNADVSGTGQTNSTAIGSGTIVNASNKVRFGNTAITVVEGQVAYSFPSDGRFKTNIQEHVPGIDFIMKLRPVTYNFQSQKFDRFIGVKDSVIEQKSASYKASEAVLHSGFIAQEVEKAAQETGYDFDGIHKPGNEHDNYSLAYSEFTVPLVKAMQEQQKMILELQKQVAELTRQVQAKK